MLGLVAKKKKLGADFPPDVVDGFNEWCELHGYTRSAAGTAALKLLQILPLPIRELAMCGDWTALAGVFGAELSAEEQARIVREFGRRIQQHQPETKGSRRKGRAVPA